jgi:hypothetical protein
VPGFIKSRSIGPIAVLGILAAAAFGQNQNARGDGPVSGQEAAQVWTSVQHLPYAAEGQGLRVMDDERKAREAAIVVSCPDVPGKALSDVDVLVGPSMKKLPGAPDNDIGGAWNLPKITPQHAARPKLTLSCSYVPETAAAGDKTPPEKKLLPIPNGAAECSFRYDNDGNRRGICSRERK